jgi:hypothetical protein
MLRFGSKGLGYHESVTAPTMLTTIAQLNDVYLAGRKLGTRYFDMGFESDHDDVGDLIHHHKSGEAEL